MTDHTPLPWVADAMLPGKVYSSDATGSVVARCGGVGFETVVRSHKEHDANARFIVRAVNAHQALVDALRAMLDDYRTEGCADINCKICRKSINAEQAARDVLASLGGPTTGESNDI